MDVTRQLANAFLLAHQQFHEVRTRWIEVSSAIGRLLPASLLTVSVQRCGELDVLVRALEDERAAPHRDARADLLLDSTSRIVMFSELWVGSAYEIIRLLDERKLAPASTNYTKLHDELRTVRVPVEKHEIARDRKLKAPLEFQRVPPRDGDEPYIYAKVKDDPTRAHILPTGFSDRGAVMWHTIDGVDLSERWLERRRLSDAFLDLWPAKRTSSH
ncbi:MULTISPECIES: hypothetical protein [unclassified Burkholderia]|uniref:hypothetical protein n=1 Tax=unclassified Burkholderia TaxID=2613784 RepID=UPI002AB16AAF|nr:MULTISPECIES: hypothetical protein [unclassified Burkholderia]